MDKFTPPKIIIFLKGYDISRIKKVRIFLSFAIFLGIEKATKDEPSTSNVDEVDQNKFDQNKFDENEEEDEQFEMLLDELGVRSVIGTDDQVLKGAADYRFHK